MAKMSKKTQDKGKDFSDKPSEEKSFEESFEETKFDDFVVDSFDGMKSDDVYGSDLTDLSPTSGEENNNNNNNNNNSGNTVVSGENNVDGSVRIKNLKLSGHSGCLLKGATNFVDGFMMGVVFGGAMGIYQGMNAGILRQPGFGGLWWRAARANGFQFGALLGVYEGSKCSFETIRGKKDFINTFMAGGLAGAVSSLRTRNPVQILAGSVAGGLIMSVMSFTLPDEKK